MTAIPINAASAASTARKFLIPVGSIVAAGLVASMMGVPWTSASEASDGVKLVADAHQGATLTISQLQPGDSVSRSVTIRNSGAQPSRLSFQETGGPAPFADGELHLQIAQDGRTLYDGNFAAMSDLAQDVGVLDPGASSTFVFKVSLPDDAPYANQGAPATASYTWTNSDLGTSDSWSG